MNDRAMTLGIGAVVAAALAVSISLFTSANAQGATQGVPPAGPRGIAGAQDLQQPRPFAQAFQGGGGGGAIAADLGVVYVLRGNTVYALSGAANGRMRVVDQLDMPAPQRRNAPGQNPFQPGGAPQRAGANPPPPGK